MRQAIRIVILVGSLFISNVAISSNWYQTYEDDEFTEYIETENITIQGNKISFWAKRIFKKPKEYQNKYYSMGMTYFTYDCKERTTGFTQMALYDKKGHNIASHNYQLEMKPVIPDTLQYAILELLCTTFKEQMNQ